MGLLKRKLLKRNLQQRNLQQKKNLLKRHLLQTRSVAKTKTILAGSDRTGLEATIARTDACNLVMLANGTVFDIGTTQQRKAKYNATTQIRGGAQKRRQINARSQPIRSIP